MASARVFPIIAGVAGVASIAAIAALMRRRRLTTCGGQLPIALFFGPAVEFCEPVRALLKTTWQIESASGSPAEWTRQAAKATALIGGLPPANDLLRASGPALKLLQCHFTGTDWLERHAVPAGVHCCNSTGQEVAIAEWVLGAMLHRLDRITENDRAMRASCLAAASDAADLGFAPPFFASPPPPPRTELSSCTVGIIGYGLIGSHIASRAAAFGCTVVATVGRAKPPKPPPTLTWLGGADDLQRLLELSDFIVVACPLSDSTRDLIGASELALMKPSAYLINIARGHVVNESALFAALRDGVIGGAAIDVWYKLPALASGQRECAPYDLQSHPFHMLPNVLLSPHTSGWSGEQIQRRIAIMAANLDAVALGRTPRNVVYCGARA